MIILELSSGANPSNTQQQQSPFSPVPVTPVNTQQQPHLHYYEDISEPMGGFSWLKKKHTEMLTKYIHNHNLILKNIFSHSFVGNPADGENKVVYTYPTLYILSVCVLTKHDYTVYCIYLYVYVYLLKYNNYNLLFLEIT